MKKYAYIRVSTKDQCIDRQLMALEQHAVPEENIYCDYQSGKDFERPAYKKMLEMISAGDLLIIKSIDRLGRNYEEILVEWQHIKKILQADILVLDMELLDTRQKKDNLTGTLIADLVLQLLAYVAQTERDFIRQRQSEGIEAAKKKGKKFGRKPLEMPEGFVEVCQECSKGKITIREAANRLNISNTTFYRRYKDYLAERIKENDTVTEISQGRLFET